MTETKMWAGGKNGEKEWQDVRKERRRSKKTEKGDRRREGRKWGWVKK